MFEINLIRNKVIQPQERKKYIKYLIITLIVCTLLFTFIIIKCIKNKYEISKCIIQKEELETEKMKIRNNSEIINLVITWSKYTQQMHLIENMLSRRILWAVRLKEINLLLPPKMCIMRMIMDPQNKDLVLEIVSLIDDGKEIDSIKKFIESLDNSNYFGPGTKLESQENVNFKNEEKLFKLIVPYAKKST